MSSLLDTKITSTRARSSTTRVYNGRLTSPLSPTSADSMRINRIGVNLAKNGNLKLQSAGDNNQTALDILTSIGCSCITDPKINKPDYSLISKQTDFELVLNPAKIDMSSFKNIGKGKVFFKNVIKDPKNAFYQLDQKIGKNYINEQEQIKKSSEMAFQYVDIVSNLYDINYTNSKIPALRSLSRSK